MLKLLKLITELVELNIISGVVIKPFTLMNSESRNLDHYSFIVEIN